MENNCKAPVGVKTIRYDRQADMDAYDKLPKTLRKALANADHSWSATSIKRAMRKQKIGAKVVIAKLHEREAVIRAQAPYNAGLTGSNAA